MARKELNVIESFNPSRRTLLALLAAGVVAGQATSRAAKTASPKGRPALPRATGQSRASLHDFMNGAQIAAASAGRSRDDTAIFEAALAAATEVVVPPGTYRANIVLRDRSRLVGAGVGRTFIKPVAGSTAPILSSSSAKGVEISGLTIDGTDGRGTDSHGVNLNLCADTRLADLSIRATRGHPVWLVNCARARGERIAIADIADPNAWAFHVQGNGSAGSHYAAISVTDSLARAVMVRDCSHVTVDDVTSTRARTAMWFQNTVSCRATNIVDREDLLGDGVVIEGKSADTRIENVTLTNCGGHGACIASNKLFGAPRNCHIANLQADRQGECIAAISDQGSGLQIVGCSIRNAHGRYPGQGNGKGPVPSEGFAIVNARDCVITGSVTAADANMTYAVMEHGGIGSSENNRFEINAWVPGVRGYGRLASSTSEIVFPKLGAQVSQGDADFRFVPGKGPNAIVYDQAALSADRWVTLNQGWLGLELTVSRRAAGPGRLLFRQGNAPLAITVEPRQRARFRHNGTRWIALGTTAI